MEQQGSHIVHVLINSIDVKLVGFNEDITSFRCVRCTAKASLGCGFGVTTQRSRRGRNGRHEHLFRLYYTALIILKLRYQQLSLYIEGFKRILRGNPVVTIYLIMRGRFLIEYVNGIFAKYNKDTKNHRKIGERK